MIYETCEKFGQPEAQSYPVLSIESLTNSWRHVTSWSSDTIRQFWQDVDPVRETVRNALSGWRVQVYCTYTRRSVTRVGWSHATNSYERARLQQLSLPSSRLQSVSYKTPGKLTSGHLRRPLYSLVHAGACAPRSTMECRTITEISRGRLALFQWNHGNYSARFFLISVWSGLSEFDGVERRLRR